MEKSIETIWKEGFLASNALVAPKINDLYNQKSKHIVDRFKRVFKINLIAIVVGSILFLGASFVVKIPVMGIGMFLILNMIVIVNVRLMNGLSKIDKSVSSYQYIKAFDGWMKEQLSTNGTMARYYYPLIFLSTVFGFWFGSFGEISPVQKFVADMLVNHSDIHTIFGIPLFIVLGIVLFVALLAFFGRKLYMLDVNIVYGPMFRKLEEIVRDMDELRK